MDMPRITVYVPDDLKARMDSAGDDLNWSALAQLAFRGAIATHALKRDPTDMTSVIERLRASKERAEEVDFAHGQRSGAEWAKASAEYDELRRLSDFHGTDNEENLDALCHLIDPEKEMDRRDWGAFWADCGLNSDPNDAFARGFIEGAAAVFEEVEDQL